MKLRPRVRQPVQPRARQRRESLLDATARILDRAGYDALTTNAVAAEAKTAIGTVYQYFPSKEALLAGLLERHRARLGEAIDRALADAEGDPLATADRAVDAFAQVWRTEPGYRAAWAATQAQSLLTRTGGEWSAAFTGRIVSVVRTFAPSTPKAEAVVIASTMVHLVSGLLLVAMTHPPRMERSLIAETKLALRAYLGARLAVTSVARG